MIPKYHAIAMSTGQLPGLEKYHGNKSEQNRTPNLAVSDLLGALNCQSRTSDTNLPTQYAGVLFSCERDWKVIFDSPYDQQTNDLRTNDQL